MKKNIRKRRLKWKHISGLFKWALTLIPALITKIFIKNLWLVQEVEYDARDNGFWLYRYIRLNHPEQKCFFVLNKKSPDYNKVDYLGKTIQPNSFSHWFWYQVANKNIGTNKASKPCPAFLNLMENKGIFKTKTYFIQHGVTKNDMKSLYYNCTKVKMFLTTAQPEYDYIKEKFGYPEGIVQYLGFPRFDGLHDDITDKDMILVMPTWRTYIHKAGPMIEGAENVETQNFLDSDFYRHWKNFLNSKELDEFLVKNNKFLYFYPHREMQPFIQHFKAKSKNIIIAKQEDNDVQTLLKKCSLIITDYSSVVFDVAYQYKPIICYQFDKELFEKGQYAKGYFDWETSKLLKQTTNLNGLLKLIRQVHRNKYQIDEETKQAIDEFFPIRDNKNCERVYEFIKNN